MDILTNTEMLRLKIKESGLKYSYIAKQLNLSAYGLQKKIEGDTEFKASEIETIKDVLNLTRVERDQIFFANM